MPTAGDVKLPAMPWTGEDPATEHSCAKRPTLMRAESVDGMVDAINVCQRNHPVTRYPFNAAARGAVTFSRYVKPFRHHANSVSTGILANQRFIRLHAATSLSDRVRGDYAFRAPTVFRGQPVRQPPALGSCPPEVLTAGSTASVDGPTNIGRAAAEWHPQEGPYTTATAA